MTNSNFVTKVWAMEMAYGSCDCVDSDGRKSWVTLDLSGLNFHDLRYVLCLLVLVCRYCEFVPGVVL